MKKKKFNQQAFTPYVPQSIADHYAQMQINKIERRKKMMSEIGEAIGIFLLISIGAVAIMLLFLMVGTVVDDHGKVNMMTKKMDSMDAQQQINNEWAQVQIYQATNDLSRRIDALEHPQPQPQWIFGTNIVLCANVVTNGSIESMTVTNAIFYGR